jgi:type I restriction enzyme S subunit
MRPYVRAANVGWDGWKLDDVKAMNFTDDEMAVYRLQPGDLLLGEASGSAAEVGKPALWSGEIENCAFQNTLIRVRPMGPEPKYLLHYFKFLAQTGKFAARSRGAGINHLGSEALASWTVPLPPIEEQRRIAAVLDAADALRAKRRQALTTLDTLTQAIFIDMFGDPVANTKGWPVEPFAAQIADVRYGTGSPPPYIEEGGVPFVRATDIKNGRIRTTGMKRISEADAETLKKCRLQAGDLIIVRSGVNTGDCAVVPDGLDGACAAYDMIVSLAPYNANFYHFLLDSKPGRRLVEPLTRRAAQPHLNAGQVRELPLIAPPVAERKRFAMVLARASRSRASMEKHVDHLDALFASLQQRAFRGEL